MADASKSSSVLMSKKVAKKVKKFKRQAKKERNVLEAMDHDDDQEVVDQLASGEEAMGGHELRQPEEQRRVPQSDHYSMISWLEPVTLSRENIKQPGPPHRSRLRLDMSSVSITGTGKERLREHESALNVLGSDSTQHVDAATERMSVSQGGDIFSVSRDVWNEPVDLRGGMIETGIAGTGSTSLMMGLHSGEQPHGEQIGGRQLSAESSSFTKFEQHRNILTDQEGTERRRDQSMHTGSELGCRSDSGTRFGSDDSKLNYGSTASGEQLDWGPTDSNEHLRWSATVRDEQLNFDSTASDEKLQFPRAADNEKLESCPTEDDEQLDWGFTDGDEKLIWGPTPGDESLLGNAVPRLHDGIQSLLNDYIPDGGEAVRYDEPTVLTPHTSIIIEDYKDTSSENGDEGPGVNVSAVNMADVADVTSRSDLFDSTVNRNKEQNLSNVKVIAVGDIADQSRGSVKSNQSRISDDSPGLRFATETEKIDKERDVIDIDRDGRRDTGAGNMKSTIDVGRDPEDGREGSTSNADRGSSECSGSNKEFRKKKSKRNKGSKVKADPSNDNDGDSTNQSNVGRAGKSDASMGFRDIIKLNTGQELSSQDESQVSIGYSGSVSGREEGIAVERKPFGPRQYVSETDPEISALKDSNTTERRPFGQRQYNRDDASTSVRQDGDDAAEIRPFDQREYPREAEVNVSDPKDGNTDRRAFGQREYVKDSDYNFGLSRAKISSTGDRRLIGGRGLHGADAEWKISDSKDGGTSERRPFGQREHFCETDAGIIDIGISAPSDDSSPTSGRRPFGERGYGSKTNSDAGIYDTRDDGHEARITDIGISYPRDDNTLERKPFVQRKHLRGTDYETEITDIGISYPIDDGASERRPLGQREYDHETDYAFGTLPAEGGSKSVRTTSKDAITPVRRLFGQRQYIGDADPAVGMSQPKDTSTPVRRPGQRTYFHDEEDGRRQTNFRDDVDNHAHWEDERTDRDSAERDVSQIRKESIGKTDGKKTELRGKKKKVPTATLR